MNTQSCTPAKQAIQAHARACDTTGHVWQPTIILGYFQCAHCSTLAACAACVLRVRGKVLLGYCQAHQQLRIPETVQEVLG